MRDTERFRCRQMGSTRCQALMGAALVVLAAGTVGTGARAVELRDAVTSKAQIVAIHCGHLVDSVAGKLLGETTVVVEGDRIQSVIEGLQWPADAPRIDLSDKTCLPGLIDSHTHLTMAFSSTYYVDKFHWNVADYVVRSTVYARETLLAGFTTVRNLGDLHNESVALRNAINAGVIVGPRIFTAGKYIGSTGGHADETDGYRQDLAGDPGVMEGIINGTDDAIKAVRLHYKLGDDLIKIMPSGGVLDESQSGDNPQLTLEEIKAIVSAAHDYGFTVAAHAHSAEAIRRAVLGGVDSIEHGTFINAEDIRLMKEHGTWFVPTLSAGDFVARKSHVPGFYPPQVAAKASTIGSLLQATTARVYAAGVKIAFGTDAGVFPHGQNAHEFELMVGAGIPPMFAIQAATIRAAELLMRSKDLGSLTAGKRADLVAVRANPLDDIRALEHIDFIMKDGSVYKEGGRATEINSSANAWDALPGGP